MVMRTRVETNETVRETFFSYLKKVLYRSARDYIAAECKRQIHVVFLEDLPEEGLEVILPSHDPFVTLTTSNFHIYLENETLASAISTFDEYEREILFLVFYHGMTTAEVAERMGVSQQAIAKKKNKLLRKLGWPSC